VNTTASNNISLFSKGLYSSWCYHSPSKTLFDCGEGCATALNNELANVERVFFSHDHGDHTLGLPSLIGCRNQVHGMSRNEATLKNNKPLTIFYPENNRLFADLFEFVNKRYSPEWLRYNLIFQPIAPGFELWLSPGVYLHAFEMRHQADQPTLGYVIYETRTRLKKEFAGQNIAALAKQPGFDRTRLSETYRANLFAYCLDAYEIVDPEQLRDCEEVVMDCTFLKSEDRGTWRLKDEHAQLSGKAVEKLLTEGKKKTDLYEMVPGTDKTHYTFDEAVALCKSVGVKKMYAAHLSSRYNHHDWPAGIPAEFDIQLLDPNQVHHL
jgi:ribonuclease Z